MREPFTPYRFHLQNRSWGLVYLSFDMAAFNLVFYFFLKALLFYPLGYSSVWTISLWFLALALVLAASGLIEIGGERIGPRKLLVQLALCFLFAWVVYRFSLVVPRGGEDTEWSWLRPEMIKVPLWFRMFVSLSPLFTLGFGAAVLGMMWLALARPRSWLLRVVPAAVAVWVVLELRTAFVETGRIYFIIYNILFAGPALLFALLLWLRSFRMAFRTVPILFHMVMILAHYLGILPVHSPRQLVPLVDHGPHFVSRIPGASVLLGPAGERKKYFPFLRRMLKDEDNLYVSYGPMGMTGLLAMDLEGRDTRELKFLGLIRDMQPVLGGRYIGCVNWQEFAFLLVNPRSLEIEQRLDLGSLDLFTPWNFLARGSAVYLTNVTFPVLAELEVEDQGGRIALAKRREINFFEAGYTKNSDGAYGLWLDQERGRIYVLVGMLEDRYLVGLVELDLGTFRILRDLRLPAGANIFPVPGTDRVLLPSYYRGEIYEVCLTTMAVVRSIPAEPSIFSLEFDAARKLLFATSRAAGLLLAIDYESGRTVRSVFVGAKPEPLLLDRENDRLYLGSEFGILRIRLAEFLGSDYPGPASRR